LANVEKTTGGVYVGVGGDDDLLLLFEQLIFKHNNTMALIHIAFFIFIKNFWFIMA
jgi:hypothetical protein